MRNAQIRKDMNMLISPFPTHSKRLIFQAIEEKDLEMVNDIYQSNSFLSKITHGTLYTPKQVMERDYQETKKLDGFSYALIETDSRKIVGYIQVILHNPNDQKPWLGLILLHPSVHGKGYGKEAINCLIAWLAENQYTSLRLVVLAANTPAIPFYQKIGFKTVQEIIYDENPAFILERSW